ncbi:MAG: SagB/ThcOx family dehydrogenase [Candidatus Omnitrophota bacterium]|jgi:SagB-type dehydrogenase family enzyme
MKTGKLLAIPLALFVLLGNSPVFAEELKPVKLLAPQTNGGKPLMRALAERKSTREFSSEELSLQTLSDLLWAANGINRPESGYRTAPSAGNRQEIDIYVARAEGLFLFSASDNVLVPVLAGDIRPATGRQSFVKDAPVDLVFVANLSKMKGTADEALFYAATDTGYVSQNVYLYCASAGLATVVLGWVDKEELAKAMRLRPDQRVILTQPVGYPKK